MTVTLDQLGEDAIVNRLLPLLPRNASLITGAGDDCAVVVRDDQWDSLLKTDVIVEGVHFKRDTSPELIGRKALARTLSDIAAMGGIPEHALVSLIVHPSRSIGDIEGIYQGISRLAEEYDVSIAGGETSSLPHDGLVVNIAMTGKVPSGQAVLRSTARPGDLIAVTGCLGDTLETGHHLIFTPRVKEGIMFREHGIATAMMDLSDGLGIDLKRMVNASGVNFVLYEANIPCRNRGTSQSAINDGEDYELLLSLNPNSINKLQHITQTNQLRTDVTIIGEIIPASLQQQEEASPGGWQHFTN